jgi:hypothetical protein
MGSSPPARSTRRIEELVFALDALPDPAAADAARELLQLVLELHGAALARIMQTIATDAAGARLAAALAEDDAIHDVLLLHDLHPADLPARIRRAVNRLHPHLAVQGVAVQSVEVDDDRVRVRLTPSDAGRHQDANADSIHQQIEQALLAAAPDAASIDIEGLPTPIAVISAAHIPVRRRAGDTAGAPAGAP